MYRLPQFLTEIDLTFFGAHSAEDMITSSTYKNIQLDILNKMKWEELINFTYLELGANFGHMYCFLYHLLSTKPTKQTV